MKSDFGTIMQLGYIVGDVPAAARRWADLGVGPFYMLEGQELDNYYFRGELTELKMTMAFGYWGDIQVELITPVNDTDNLYTRALKDAPGKLNHYATIVADLDALLDAHNLGEQHIIQSGSMSSGVKFVYLDEFMPGGLHLELIQSPESAQQGFEGMKAVAKAWNGENPVRSMMSLGEDLAALKK